MAYAEKMRAYSATITKVKAEMEEMLKTEGEKKPGVPTETTAEIKAETEKPNGK